jgi:hypothetical protein
LKPGAYELHVSGTVDVAWREPSFVQTGALQDRRFSI